MDNELDQLLQQMQTAPAPEPIDTMEPVEEEVEEEKEKNIKMDEYELVTLNENIGTDIENRRFIDAQWYVYDNYVRGNHFVKYNEDTQAIELVPQKTATRFPINKIYSTLRSVRGFVTKYDPKWEVYPDNKSKKSLHDSKYKSKVLDDIWYHKGLKNISKQKVFNGLKFSIGIVQLGWDSEKQEPTFTVWDPYETFFGGGVGPYATRVTVASRMRIVDIENNEAYKGRKGTLTETNRDFASDTRQYIQDLIYGSQNKSQDDAGAIVYETFYVTDEENGKGGKINIATYTDTCFLRHIETEYKSLWDIFLLYRSDDNPGETYGEGWVKHLIPVQKMLDILESNTMEYHHMFAKGRYVVPKNSGVKIITNENGTILEHNPGRRPVIENAPSMAASVDNQIGRLNTYLEDLGGQHDASLGRIPTGATAGVAIEALQEGDANNLKDLRENFEIDLVNTAKAIFKMYALKLKTTKIIECDDKDGDGNPDHFAIIGEKATNIPEQTFMDGKPVPVVVIRYDEKVRVTVGTWLAHTKEALESRVYKHYTAGLIDRKTALEMLEYSDPDTIISSAIKEQVITQMTQAGPPEVTPDMMGPAEGEAPAEEMMSPEAAIPTPPM